VFAVYRSFGYDFQVARHQLDFVVLLGPDAPGAREAADEARAVFERIEARPFLERLSNALAGPGRTTAPDRTGDRARSSVTSAEAIERA